MGRYIVYDQQEIGSGGMATVRLGKLVSEIGEARVVAIKCLHGASSHDQRSLAMLADEARVSLRIRHPNVVSTLDVLSDQGQLLVVMEYIHGPSLSVLIREARERGWRIPMQHVVAIMAGVLEGLHAAHEALSSGGKPLGIVHRDVSPQNILIGADGTSRVFDFGVAKAKGRYESTRDGEVKGKVAYMAPEQILGETVDRRADIYSASVVAWEMFTGTKMISGDYLPQLLANALLGGTPSIRSLNPEVPTELDQLVMRGLARTAVHRFATAREMAIALEGVLAPASPRELGAWVQSLCGPYLNERAARVVEVENDAPSVSESSIPPRWPLSLQGVDLVSQRGTGPSHGVRINPVSGTSGADERTVLEIVRMRSDSRRAWLIPATALAVLSVVVIFGLGKLQQPAVPANPSSGVRPTELLSARSAGVMSAVASSAVERAPTSSLLSASAAPSAEELRGRTTTTRQRIRANRSPADLLTSAAANSSALQPQKPATSTPAGTTATQGECNPPFVIDHRGVRVPKAECL